MLNVTLVSMHDTTRPIQGIKAVRAAGVPTEPGRSSLGLREAKDIVDAVRGLNTAPRPVTFLVRDEACLADLSAEFSVTVAPVQPEGISRQIVLDVLFEAVALMTPAQSAVFLDSTAVKAAREAL